MGHRPVDPLGEQGCGPTEDTSHEDEQGDDDAVTCLHSVESSLTTTEGSV
jgi:hypothetical protein